MDNQLIVYNESKIAIKSSKKDILEIYGVPSLLDDIIKKEKSNLVENLAVAGVLMDAINKIGGAKEYVVEIPSALKKLLKNGKATFDKSKKIEGHFTPNIRIKGENGINTQVTLSENTDINSIGDATTNLAMMAMLQSILAKLEAVEESLEDIKKGQMNDRIGEVIGSFRSLVTLYPTFKTNEEKNVSINNHYQSMSIGLAQINLYIDEIRKKIDKFPGNNLKLFWYFLRHPGSSVESDFIKTYNDYLIALQVYHRLLLMSDMILFLKGDRQAIKNNHIIIDDYCNMHLDNEFSDKMKFITNNKIDILNDFLRYRENLNESLRMESNQDLKISYTQQEIRL